ncbi:NAD-dependent epimerase/dehydratase family protein [Mycolicibacterium boenickei]
MKVLVTGGTGFTGSHTVRALAASGHAIRLLVRDADKARRIFQPHGFVPDDLVVGDMTDAAAVEDALRGCDGVLHAAALVDLRRGAARRVEESNVRGVELVVGGAARLGLPAIVHVSSLGVFFTPGGPPLSVELPIAPAASAYARSKAHAEVYVRRLQEDGAPIRISYPALVLGPDDPGMSAGNNGICSFIKDIGLITSSGMQCVDVRDLATVHTRLLELPNGAHRYAATGEMLCWEDVFALLDELTGRHMRRIAVPGWLLRAAGSAGDVVKRVYDFDFPLSREAMEFTTRWPGADAGRTAEDLGLRFRAAEDTYRDTVVWMYRAGHLTKSQVGRLAV